jgi:hypothetical protein
VPLESFLAHRATGAADSQTPPVDSEDVVDVGRGTVLASPGSKPSSERQQTRDAHHSDNNKAADHGERIFVDSQHTASSRHNQ